MPINPTIPAPENQAIQDWIDQAKEDLAQRLNVEIGQIELVGFESKVWSDASLGCPQPGMAYIQVPQDGYLIVLQVNAQQFNYHGDGSRNQSPFLCEQADGNKDLSLPPSSGADN